MKWYNYETLSRKDADLLSMYLKTQKIKYERSACYDGYHFEIYVDNNTLQSVNAWLDVNINY